MTKVPLPDRECKGCDKQFRDEDVAPYQVNPDGSFTVACRKCHAEWIKLGIMPPIPFWQYKELERNLGATNENRNETK